MIICNNIQETIDAQSGEIVTIGFNQKANGGLHLGHIHLIQEAKIKYPDKTFLVFVWSDDWRDERSFPPGYTETTAFDKDYMIDWFKDKVDIISFIDKNAQVQLFNSIDLENLEIWAENIFNTNKYKFGHPEDNLDDSSDFYIKWAMLISRTYELVGIKRDYVVVSKKDGWYSYAMKHFYDNYIPSIKEVYLADSLTFDGIPFSTSIPDIYNIDKTIEEIKTYENSILFGDKILVQYTLKDTCFQLIRGKTDDYQDI